MSKYICVIIRAFGDLFCFFEEDAIELIVVSDVVILLFFFVEVEGIVEFDMSNEKAFIVMMMILNFLIFLRPATFVISIITLHCSPRLSGTKTLPHPLF